MKFGESQFVVFPNFTTSQSVLLYILLIEGQAGFSKIRNELLCFFIITAEIIPQLDLGN